ncbi:MAG: hypothetical protein HMLKMBBP_01641 [Planctomycetes bacterium]|nr:hypothetical protein [Planctomycetota bacterium]
MPGSITMYLPAPWTVESAARWMASELQWIVRDPTNPTRLELGDVCRAWVEPADEDTISIGARLGDLRPSVYVLFDPRVTAPRGVRPMVATVIAFAERSAALLLLYQSEEVLLCARGGVLHIPPSALDWWQGEDALDMVR